MNKIYILVGLLTIIGYGRIVYVGSNEPYTTIMSGINFLNGGDTLIIRNGVYYGAANRIDDIPSGNAENYTYIRAETIWGVTIDLQQSSGEYGCNINNDSYITIEGIHFTNSDLTLVNVTGHSQYIKILKCSASEASGGNHYNFGVRRSNYVLIEDCFAYGFGRYSFMATGQTFEDLYVVFRRCVARNENVGNDPGDGRQTSSFGSYQENHVYFQNCIAIDGIEDPNPYSTFVWMTPNGANNIKYQDCIHINNIGHLWYWEGSDTTPSTGIEIENCLFLGNKPGPYVTNRRYSGQNSAASSLAIRNISIIDCDSYVAGVHCSVSGRYTIDRSVFWNNVITSGGLVQNGIPDSILFWNNSSPRNFNNYSAGVATNTYNNSPPRYNPSQAYKYPPIRETNSGLAADQMGHDIQYRRGVSGTLYGEPGWDSLTNDSLWPWEYQDVIYEKMRSYSAHGMNGNRGFCVDGESLTNYIMNWFGNGNPFEVPLPSRPQNVHIEP